MRRRMVLATTGGVITGGIAGCLSAPRRGSSDRNGGNPSPDDMIPAGTWPQVGYDSQNTRHTPDARGPRDDATIAWASLGGRPVYPPVVDDALYFTEAWTGGTALALSTQDGEERWSNADLPPMRWAPALHENLMFVITREEGNVVRLHALETTSGTQAWVRKEGITASSGEHPPISPTIRDGSVYIGSNRGVIRCDAATGDIEWTAKLGPHVVETDNGPTWRTDWAKPAVTADRVFTFDMNENYRATREVYAVDRASGDHEWTAELEVGDGWSLSGHVVAGSDLIYVTANKPTVSLTGSDSMRPGDGRLFALDPTSGEVVWDWQRSDRTLSPPAYAGGSLYLVEHDPAAETHQVYALTASEGANRWTYQAVNAFTIPTVAGDTVFISHGNALVAVAASDGARRWRLDVGASAGWPVIVDDTVYLQTNPGRDYDSQLLAIREP